MLQPDGLADHTLDGVGLHSAIHDWLADPSIVLYSVFVVISWKYFGFHMVLYLAGLQQIPKELEEAAAIDGATDAADLPLRHAAAARPDDPDLDLPVDHRRDPALRPRVGDDRRRPGDASNTMAVYMIDHGFKRFEFGYASAVARDHAGDLARRSR